MGFSGKNFPLAKITTKPTADVLTTFSLNNSTAYRYYQR
jgi:hypothetical protein